MSFSSSINLSSLNGANGFRLEGVAGGGFPDGDNSGFSVASAGDVNGDGFADLIVGAPYANPAGNGPTGASYVVFGKLGGFASSINLSSLNGANGFRLDSDNANVSGAGYSVSSGGDINGDGYGDLIIGAPSQSPGYNGASYVVFGKANGFTSTINLFSLNGTAGFRLDGVAAGDCSGFSVASAGDVNGDGLGDVIIGAPAAKTGSGASYVVFGKSSGFASPISLSSLTGNNGFALTAVAANDMSGRSVASAGDVNGDGFADLIIGAPGANGWNGGASYVVFGKASGFASSINLSSLDGMTGFKLDGVAGGGYSGYSVSTAGDVNGDGFADVIIGNPGATASYIVFGKGGGFAPSINLSSLNGSNGFWLDGVRAIGGASDGCGRSVASAGDLNGDGFADLIVGADGANGGAGASYVVFGKATAFASSIAVSSLNGSTGFKLNGVATADWSGFSVASAGDVNGDGTPDLIVGAYQADPNGSGSGASYVYFSPATGSATYRGTTLADRLHGTAFGDVMNGNAGNDTITGEAGNDTIDAGAGNDTVIWALGDGNDTVTLGTGTNRIDFGNNAFTYVDIGPQRIFTIGSATVTVTDWTAGTNSVVSYNQAPSITSGGTASFRENATGTIYTATGTDADAGTTLTYALGGVDAGRFNINAASGVVTFKASPDFEAPADVGGNNVYDITVAASDGSLSSAAQAVAITVINVNEAPSITSGGTASFAENATGTVYTATGTDPDAGTILTYALVLGGADNSLFNINATSGAVTFKTPPDFEARTFYQITVAASDGSLSSETKSANITVTNVNEAPSITSAAAASFAENANGTAYTATGIDPDSNSTLTFTLGGTDAGLFNINAASGAVTFKTSPNFEVPADAGGNNVYDITVAASDGVLSSAARAVAVSVTDTFEAPINPVSPASISLSILNGTNGFRIDGVAAGDQSGYSVASAGDVNGDGISDLIVGAPGANASYVLYGKTEGFSSSINLSSVDGTTGFRLDGVSAGDQSGYSVASAGDVNGDGYSDLMVGAPSVGGVTGYMPGNFGRYSVGASYLIFGKATGFASTVNLSNLDGSNGLSLRGSGFPGKFGSFSVTNQVGYDVASAGDVNGDGLSDLIFGGSNTSYVVFGKASGYASYIIPSYLDGTTGFQVGHATSVSTAGDVNGDGYADIIVGTAGSNEAAGASYVVFGKATGFASFLNISSLDGSNGFSVDGVTVNDRSGSSVSSAGDVNGDGYADLIIGAPNANGNVGASYVVFGRASGFASSISLSSLNGTNGFRLDGGASNDFSGYSVAAAGDLNGDGFADLIVGAYGSNGAVGASYVVYGKAAGFASAINLPSLDGSNGFRLVGVAANDWSGRSVASAGDVNGDGIPDLVVGAPYSHANGTDSGSSYVVFGKTNGGATYRGTTLADNLHGTAFGDSMTGNAGNDILTSVAGNDTIDGGAGNDTLDGGAGIDTASYASATAGVTVSLALSSSQTTGGAGTDTLISIENLTGSGFNDGLTGTNGDNVLTGGAGNDSILDGQGKNLIDGGDGIDTLWTSYAFGVGYTVAGTNSNFTISGASSTESVSNIELVHFRSGNTVPVAALWNSALSVAIANQLFVSYMGRAGDVQWRAATAAALDGGQPSVDLQKNFYSRAVTEGVFGLNDSSLTLVNKVFYQIFNFGASDWEQQAWVNLVDAGILAKEQLPWGMFVGYLGSTTVPDAYRVPCQCKLLAVDAYTNELLNNSGSNTAMISSPEAFAAARNYVAGVNNISTAASAILKVAASVASISSSNGIPVVITHPLPLASHL